MDDDDEWQIELWFGWTLDVPAWCLTRPVVFVAGVVCGLVLGMLAFLAGLVSAYA